MSWGTELWDQYENLSVHTQKGIDFLEKYGHFIKERCTIELDYAGKLRRLVKSYQPKRKEEEDYHQYTPCKAFKQIMNETNDLAGQHEVVAETLVANVMKEINILVKDFKEERKKYLQEGARLQAALQAQLSSLDRAKKSYEKAFKEAERALDAYQKADADLNLSRAEVEKQRMNMSLKSQQCEDCKNEYANQLQKANELQNQHYNFLMPAIFQHLQDMDEKRIKSIKNFMRQSVDVERSVYPIINQCLDEILRAADQIDEKQDTLMVIERYQSGFEQPADIPFEDLSAIKNGEAPPMTNNVPIMAIRSDSLTVKGTLSAGKLKKRGGIFGIFSSTKEDYSDLPPNQRKKKLQMKLDEMKTKIQQESAARDGLMKMKGVYENNPALGDPMSIEGQLNESAHRLEKFYNELSRFQSYLDDATGGGSPHRKGGHNQSNVNGSSPRPPHRHSGSDESLSRSASDSSVSNANAHKQSAPGTPLPSHGSSNSPESGLGTSHTSLPDSDPDCPPDNDPDADYFDADSMPILGMCRALYAFEATSEGSIPMHDGEELYIIEVDQGDGWTRVRRTTDYEEGFVPSSYISCQMYNSC